MKFIHVIKQLALKLKNKILLIVGCLLLFISLVSLFVVGLPTVNGKTVNFTVGDNILKAKYYPVQNSEQAILLCGGFSSDQQMMRPLANLFVQNGISAMTFDYSGHGSSFGTVGFDNATNGQIANEISFAINKLSTLTGLPQENIILLGHSMGGRSILELYTTANKPLCKEVILLSPQINYDNNTQSTAFTGINDADIFPWNTLSSKIAEDIRITLIGSTGDDIVSVQSITEIYNRLSDNGEKNNVSLFIVDMILHSYMPYSTSVAKTLLDNIGINSSNVYSLSIMYFSLLLSAIGIFIILAFLNKKLNKKTSKPTIELINYKKFIVKKLLIFIPSLLIMVIIACLAVLIPFGAPIMSIAFIGGIAGYGIISLLTYRFGKMSGVVGKLKFNFKTKNKQHLLFSLVLFVLSLFVLDFILGSSLYNLLPFNMRLFWLFFAGIFMSIGFYVGDYESAMLKHSSASVLQIFAYNIVQYLLLFLMAIGYLAIGSFSGLSGLLQNLILMYICIFTGNAITKLSNPILGSLSAAFLFQATILTSTCLMVVF